MTKRKTLRERAYAAAVRAEGYPITDGRGNMVSCTNNTFFSLYESGYLAGYRAGKREGKAEAMKATGWGKP